MSFEEKLQGIVARHRDLASSLAAGGLGAQDYVRLSKEYAELAPIVESIETLRKRSLELAGLETLIGDPASDAEMKAFAEEEYRAAHQPAAGHAGDP